MRPRALASAERASGKLDSVKCFQEAHLGVGSTTRPSLVVKPAPGLGATHLLRTSLSRNDYEAFSYHPPDMQRSLDSYS